VGWPSEWRTTTWVRRLAARPSAHPGGCRRRIPYVDEASQQRLLTITQVAERTQLPVEMIRWLRQQGRFAPDVKVDRRLLWDVADLDAWLIVEQRQSAA